MRLSEKTFERLTYALKIAGYSRNQACGVVHLGVGAFHRAHQAVYFDRLLAMGEKDWMIAGASLRSDKVANQLNPQDGLFGLNVEDSQNPNVQIVRSIKEAIVAPNNPMALINKMSAPETALVTLTITEKGYCLDLGTRQLDLNNENLKSDIADLSSPRTAPGFLVAALNQRRKQGLPPFTVMSCDNIPDNGDLTKKAVLGLAKYIDQDLASWIEKNGAFPSTMVDRIVPATTEKDIAVFEEKIGLTDLAMVKTEAFSQWVVEDEFSDRRPDLDKVGVQFTDDVTGWEDAKLRLLNGAHSSLAYLGGLAGFRYVHEAIANKDFRAFIERLWDEVEPTLKPVKGLNVSEYRQDLLKRFENKALMHQTYQIATDGSQKIPQRFLASWKDRYASGLKSPALSLAIASWIKWQMGRFDSGESFIVNDPLAEKTSLIVEDVGSAPETLVTEFLKISQIFGSLRQNEEFFGQVLKSLIWLNEFGAAKSVRKANDVNTHPNAQLDDLSNTHR